jgi:aspartate aminotransferase/aminotransferase
MSFLPSKVVSDSSEALSIKYNTIVYDKQRKGEDVIILSLGEAFFDIPLFSFDSLPRSKIYHYSHSRGIPELRKKLSEYYFQSYNVKTNYETEMLITAGSKIGIHMSLMSILDPSDEVLIHEPAWVSYTEEVKLCYGVPVHIPYSKSVYDYERYITKKTKMIIINNPNNPTGKVYNKDEINHLYNLAKKHSLVILSDEAYSDFLPDRNQFFSIGCFDVEKKHSIIVNSMSKNYGMSGWRIGYVISNAYFINQLLKVNQHLITCPATILEYYLTQYFTDIIDITMPQIRKLLAVRKETAEYMNSISLNYLAGEATFYFFTSIKDSKLSSEEFAMRLLKEQNVSVVPGVGYGKSCDKFIRISIGTESLERIKKGLDTIKDLIVKTSS